MHKIKIALVNVVIAISIIAIGAALYISFTNHKNEYSSSISDYNKNMRRLMRLVSSNTELEFLTIDQTLHTAVERQYFQQLFNQPTKDGEQNLASLVNKTPHIDAMLFTDENGVIKTLFKKGENTFDIKSGTLFPMVDHFNYHKNHPEQEVFISIPQKDDKSLNGRIFVSRRIEKINGEFGGLAIVIMDSSYLVNLIDSIDTGKSTEISLILNDNDFLADTPDSAPKLTILKAMMSESGFNKAEDGEIKVASRTINDNLNMFAFQKIVGFPITIAIVAKETDIFADWHQSRNLYFGLIFIFAVFAITIISFTTLLAKKVIQAKISEKKILLASKAKSDFLAKMSHELRTPLNAVIGFSEMLSSGYFGKVNHMQVERLNDINMCGTHLLELISDILEFSKGEAGKLQLNEEDTDMYSISRQALRMVEQKAKKKEIELITTITRETPMLLADRRKLKQIIINLLSNSIKFTNNGGKILLASHFDNYGNFIVTVSDTGIGISREDIPRAMTVFEQIHRDKDSEGTGLGLPLCKILIELHGGTLRLESKVNVGTKVSVLIPANRVKKKLAYEQQQPVKQKVAVG